MILIQNTNAPDFSLPDQNGKLHSLHDYKGKWVLVYFYPKDFTSGCTTEACSIRDNWEEFRNKGIVVLGISKDSVESHKKFASEHKLPFTLLSDVDKKVLKQYGAWQGKTLRISYLINPQGKIAKVYPKVDPKVHVKQILEDKSKLE
ncbi:peroxiredoxin [Candidatus Gottesmanbacteria bacterium]|nr:peroxiredoxin [Candidatus Gottesmanbacteria bacterium]